MSSRISFRNPINPPAQPAPPTAQDPTPPAPSPILGSIVDALDPAHNTTASTGSWKICHVQPDQRFPLVSWIFSVMHTMQSSMYNRYPLASPASILGYCICLYIGMHFHCDANLVPYPSRYALDILDDSVQSFLFNMMLDLPVPPFMATELEAIRPFIADLATNVGFFPTLASSNLLIDFGRMLPANMFFILHNLMASLPGNASTAHLQNVFYRATITIITINNREVNVTPAHYLGYVRQTDDTATRYRNWLNDRVNLLVNALAIRPVSAMSIPGHLPVGYPSYVDLDDYNPYLFNIGFSQNVESTYSQFFHSLAQFVRATFPSAKPLRAYTQTGSFEIARYLSFGAPYPTWHTDENGLSNATPDDLYSPTAAASTPRQFADATNYLGSPQNPATNPTDTNEFFNLQQYPRPADADFRSVQLVEEQAPPANHGSPIRFLVRTDALRSGPTPPCIIFDPTSNSTTHLAAVIVSGKIIEIGDLDVIGIHAEDTGTSLFHLNSEIFGGLIPMSQINNGTTDTTTRVLARPSYNGDDYPIVLSRGFGYRNTLPLFRRGIINGTYPGAAPTLAQLFPTFFFQRHAAYASTGGNVMATTYGTNFPYVPDHNLRVWSSYRVERRAPNGTTTWYIVPSLRPTFGYYARLFSSLHPALRIP